MEKEKSINVKWAEELDIEKMMDDMAEKIKEIRCPFCRGYIKIPLIARDVDIKIFKHHVECVNKFVDEIIKFTEETYGIDLRHEMLLKTIIELQGEYLKPKPKIVS